MEGLEIAVVDAIFWELGMSTRPVLACLSAEARRQQRAQIALKGDRQGTSATDKERKWKQPYMKNARKTGRSSEEIGRGERI